MYKDVDKDDFVHKRLNPPAMIVEQGRSVEVCNIREMKMAMYSRRKRKHGNVQ